MGERVRAGTLDIWAERQRPGPDAQLIAGLGDPAEAWPFQLDGLADRYRLTAYDSADPGVPVCLRRGLTSRMVAAGPGQGTRYPPYWMIAVRALRSRS